MPVNKIVQILLDAEPFVADAFTLGAEDTVANDKLVHLSTGANTTTSQHSVGLVENYVYLVTITTIDASFATGYEALQLGGGPEIRINSNLTNAVYPMICGNSPSSGFEKTSVGQTSGDTIKFSKIAITIQNFKPSANINELFAFGTDGVTPAVRGEYIQSGTLNSKPAYLFDASYSLSWNGSVSWEIREGHTPGSGDLKFVRTDSSQLGDYTAYAGSSGTVTLTYGPTDHTTTAGTPIIVTDGMSGYISLKTSYDFLNNMRAGKFAVVNILKALDLDGDSLRLMSSEASDYTGYMVRNNESDVLQWNWSSQAVATNIATDIDKRLYMATYDGSYFRAYVDDTLKATDAYSGLGEGVNTELVLGAKAYNKSFFANAGYGFTAILDLSGIVTMDATWCTGLAVAINAAGVMNKCNAKAIANAIHAYDANIAGYYWSLNEIRSGDPASYYILARDIEDDSEQTSDFYGLVTKSGVAASSLSNLVGMFIQGNGGQAFASGFIQGP